MFLTLQIMSQFRGYTEAFLTLVVRLVQCLVFVDVKFFDFPLEKVAELQINL